MLTLGAVLGVAAIAFGLVITPGPNMIYLVSRTIAQGRRAGLLSLVGVGAGFVIYLLATTAGLAALFVAVPVLFTVVKLVGAAYLLYLAWTVVRPGSQGVFTTRTSAEQHHSSARLVLMGFTTCLLNPKIALMYAALLPQFVDPAFPAGPQLLSLGLVQVAVAVSVNAGWVLAAGWVSTWLMRRPRAQRVQRLLTGSVLGAFAVHLAASPNRP